MSGPSILRTAHGEAAKYGARLVAECPPLDELKPLNADDTANALAMRKARGRPFQKGNTAAAGRGPSLTRIAAAADTPEERRRVMRKAASLKNKRVRELCVAHGLETLSSAVHVELIAWARATSWAAHFELQGNTAGAFSAATQASAHGLKAIAIAEREAAGRAKRGVLDDMESEAAAKMKVQ